MSLLTISAQDDFAHALCAGLLAHALCAGCLCSRSLRRTTLPLESWRPSKATCQRWWLSTVPGARMPLDFWTLSRARPSMRAMSQRVVFVLRPLTLAIITQVSAPCSQMPRRHLAPHRTRVFRHTHIWQQPSHMRHQQRFAGSSRMTLLLEKIKTGNFNLSFR